MRTQMLKSSLNHIKTSINASKSQLLTRKITTKAIPHRKVTILGASGGVGQSLAALLKLNPLISTLSLYDLSHTFTLGVAADISHIPTKTKVIGYDTIEDMEKALEGSDIVIIPAGATYDACMMTERAIFPVSTAIVKDLCVAISKYCPNALINIITNPLNSTVPLAAEVLKNAGTYDPKRLFGVTTLDVFFAQTSYVEMVVMDPADVTVPVIGGHGELAIPLFAQAEPKACLFGSDHRHLIYNATRRIDRLVHAKAGKGSATLSMAVAAAKFADSCLKGLNGVPDVTEYAYVESDLIPTLPFFASKVRLGKNGMEEIIRFGSPSDLSDFEKRRLIEVIQDLRKSIDEGVQVVNPEKCCESTSPPEKKESSVDRHRRERNTIIKDDFTLEYQGK